jgi:DNA-binding protein VF530
MSHAADSIVICVAKRVSPSRPVAQDEFLVDCRWFRCLVSVSVNFEGVCLGAGEFLDSGLGVARFLPDMPESASHPNDPLHGVTLETVLRAVVERHGWERMADQIQIRCFMFNPTIRSSLTFLRKNPWARKKLEDWYVYDAIRDRSTS